jgi:hypothetical protein
MPDELIFSLFRKDYWRKTVYVIVKVLDECEV